MRACTMHTGYKWMDEWTSDSYKQIKSGSRKGGLMKIAMLDTRKRLSEGRGKKAEKTRN